MQEKNYKIKHMHIFTNKCIKIHNLHALMHNTEFGVIFRGTYTKAYT